jgi:dTDP-4-amino-4,6-dideoxygalactose transaminase
MDVARRHGLYVVEDACAAAGAAYAGKAVGSFGHLAAFSMHPLKPLHVWGDGGAVVTNDDRAARWLRLDRNHGMVTRDEIEIWGINQRLQTLQAVVANRVLDRVRDWVDRRIEIARRIDAGLADTPQIRLPPRPLERRNAFQLYIVRCEQREKLLKYLASEQIEAKASSDPAPPAAGSPRSWAPATFLRPRPRPRHRDATRLPVFTDIEIEYMIDHVTAAEDPPP